MQKIIDVSSNTATSVRVRMARPPRARGCLVHAKLVTGDEVDTLTVGIDAVLVGEGKVGKSAADETDEILGNQCVSAASAAADGSVVSLLATTFDPVEDLAFTIPKRIALGSVFDVVITKTANVTAAKAWVDWLY